MFTLEAYHTWMSLLGKYLLTYQSPGAYLLSVTYIKLKWNIRDDARNASRERSLIGNARKLQLNKSTRVPPKKRYTHIQSSSNCGSGQSVRAPISTYIRKPRLPVIHHPSCFSASDSVPLIVSL